jgi:hypothetical protein
MPVLSRLQRRAGRELGSRTAVADSKQTLLCTYLSAVLLVGLVLNSALGWWWADAGAALVIAGIAVREGINAWKGDVCCTIPHTNAVTGAETGDCWAAPDPDTDGNHNRLDLDTSAAPAKNAEEGVAAGCCEGRGSSPEPKPVSLTLGPRDS